MTVDFEQVTEEGDQGQRLVSRTAKMIKFIDQGNRFYTIKAESEEIGQPPDVPEDVLEPSASWGDKEEYWKKYDALAARFIENFKLFESGCSLEVQQAGPKRYSKVK